MLLGILYVADTTGAAVLTRAGFRYDDVESTLERLYEQDSAAPTGRVVRSAEAKRLLAYALDEARSDGDGLITTVHLALACSRVDALPSIRSIVGERAQAIRREQAWIALERREQRGAKQRLDALVRANAARRLCAQLKKDLKAGRRAIDDTLLDPPTYIKTAKVVDIMLAVPTYGRVKTNKLLAQCRISPSKTIGGLSARQRDELVVRLRR